MLRTLLACCALAVASTAFPAQAQDSDRLADGKKAYRKCMACHTLGEGERHKVGPNLWGLFGRAAATADGFSRYSKAMKESGIIWDAESVDGYLESPRKFLPGTNMAFIGVRKPAERAALLAYLMAETGASQAADTDVQ
ncbi:MAG: c-type cytochrome [Alphaproteobacteria bacterium]